MCLLNLEQLICRTLGVAWITLLEFSHVAVHVAAGQVRFLSELCWQSGNIWRILAKLWIISLDYIIEDLSGLLVHVYKVQFFELLIVFVD